jgi:flagellar basal body-associated protein FliL
MLHLLQESNNALDTTAMTAQQTSSAPFSSTIIALLTVVVILAIASVIGFFLYHRFYGNK